MMNLYSQKSTEKNLNDTSLSISYQRLAELVLAINGIKLVRNNQNERSTYRSTSLQNNLSRDDKVVIVNTSTFKIENSRDEESLRKFQDTYVSERETSINLTSMSEHLKFSSLLKPSLTENSQLYDDYLTVEEVKNIKKKCKDLFYNKLNSEDIKVSD